MNSSEPRSNRYLEQALDGKNPETKARIMALIQELGLSPDDPLFLFCIAIGHLESLAIAAPEQWQTTFAAFHESIRADLQSCQDHQSKTLETTERMTDAIAAMTRSLDEQNAHTSGLLTVYETMSAQSGTTDGRSPKAADQLDDLNTQLQEWIAESKRDLQHLMQTVSRLNVHPGAPPSRPGMPLPTAQPDRSDQTRRRRNSGSQILSILLGAILCVTATTSFLVYQIHQSNCPSPVSPQSLGWRGFKA
jgi:hypothetical protein